MDYDTPAPSEPKAPKKAKPVEKPKRPVQKLSAHDFLTGSRQAVLARAFLAHLKNQQRAGKGRKSGTRAEWEADFEAFRKSPIG